MFFTVECCDDRPASTLGGMMTARIEDVDFGGLPLVSQRLLADAERFGALPAADAVRWRRKGSWLFQAGMPVTAVFAVLDGAVVRRKASVGGESLAVDLVTRGGILGYRAYLGYGSHRLSAQCVADTLVCQLEIDDLERALANDRELERDLLAEVAQDLNTAHERILQVATLSVRDRLLIVLAQLSRDFTTMNDENTQVLAPPVSRTDMAALAGMTPESLSRCIRTLEAEGLAHFSRHHVVIGSVARFRGALEAIGVCADGSVELSLAS